MIADLSARPPTTTIAGFFAKQFLLCLLCTLFAFTCRATVIVLSEGKRDIPLNHQIEFYEDKTDLLTIVDITSGKAGSLFKSADLEKLIYINSNAAFWFKFSTLNTGKDVMSSILELGYHYYDSIWLYKVNPDHTYSYELMGDLVPYNSRRVKTNDFAFFLASPPGQTQDYYVRIRCREVVKFNFNIYDNRTFYVHSSSATLLVGGLLMTFLAMFFSNFFIMIFTGNKGHIFYLLMVISAFGVALVINGIGFHYLWPDHPWFQHAGEYIFEFMGNPALTLFAQSFLKTRDKYPKAHKILNALLSIWVLCFVVTVLFKVPLGIASAIQASLALMNVVVILALAIFALSQKYEPALFFLAGTFCSMIAIIIYYLMVIGYVRLNFWSFYLPQLLLVIDTVLLSIALSENIRRMREEITRAQIEKKNYLIEINRMKEDANIELKKQVEERTAELEAVNKELEAFSYSVSHDLKAPLRGIVGFAQILRKQTAESPTGKGSDYAGKIVTAADKMNNIIADLLLLSKVAKGELQLTTFNPTDLITPIWQELIKGKDKVPELIAKPITDIHADENLMQYVFNNLISNAIKYSSKKDHAVVEIGTMKRDDQTIVYIKDNGAGFDMKYADKLFQPFQRLHGSSEFEGTGIGLSIVKRIIDRHGGKLWAEAELDKGATFFFSIPDQGKD